MTASPHGWVDPNPPDPADPRTPVILAVSGVLLTVLVAAALIGAVLLSTGRDAERSAGEVTLVAANAPSDETFSRSILVAPVSISDQSRYRSAELLEQLPVRADRGVRVVSGRQPELYGAAGAAPPCDIVTLANDLDADAVTAQRWAAALGLSPQQIPHYLNTLTPAILLADTWVTAHAPGDGTATPKQVVLQAGNAVLIDTLGVPRTHCVTGAPLTPPANDTLTNYRFVGDTWPDLAPQNVVAVNYANADAVGAATEFTLIDVNTGEQVVRPITDTIDLGGTSTPLPDPAVMNVAPPASPTASMR